MTAWWDRARQRLQEWLQPPTSGPAGTDTLLLSVSDLGWQGKLLHADGRAAEALGDPASGLEDVQGGAVEVLRRAVRSIPLAMRGEISSVSLMIADPARIDAEALAIQAWNSDHARFPSRRVTTSTSLRDALEEVRAPLSVIYGERDAITLPDLASRIAFFRARGAETQVVPGAGHWVAFEAPAAVNAALLG